FINETLKYYAPFQKQTASNNLYYYSAQFEDSSLKQFKDLATRVNIYFPLPSSFRPSESISMAQKVMRKNAQIHLVTESQDIYEATLKTLRDRDFEINTHGDITNTAAVSLHHLLLQNGTGWFLKKYGFPLKGYNILAKKK
ncbi:MAG: hypothetical protein WCI04_07555, partial [archaeon]